MAERAEQVFRLDNEVLAFRFAATLSHRAGAEPFERLTTPERLHLWLDAADLPPAQPVDDFQLAAALTLREAIYLLGAAIASGITRPTEAVTVLNAATRHGLPAAVLTDEGWRWNLSRNRPVEDALAVIAADAITAFGASDSNRIKTCEGTDCSGLYLDTSRGNNRRWCSMNTCGNKAKKSRMNPH